MQECFFKRKNKGHVYIKLIVTAHVEENLATSKLGFDILYSKGAQHIEQYASGALYEDDTVLLAGSKDDV